MNYLNHSILTAIFLLMGMSASFGQISLNSNTNSSPGACDAFSYTAFSQDIYPYETHGIPTAPTPNSSTNLTTLECNGMSGSQGFAVAYFFEANHTYTISLTARTMAGAPTLVVKASNVAFASNNGCSDYYGTIPSDNSTIYGWNGMSPFNALNANAISMHDGTGNTSIKMDKNYSKLWIYLANTTGAGKIGFSHVTITDLQPISTTGTGTPEPINCSSGSGQICSANASIYYNVKPGTSPGYTAIGSTNISEAYSACDSYLGDAPNFNSTYALAYQNYYIGKRIISGNDTLGVNLPGTPIQIDRSTAYITKNNTLAATPGTQVNQLSSGTLRSLLIKSAGTLVDKYTIYKDLVARYCTDNFLFYHGGCGEHIESTSNTIGITLCSFDNPLAVTSGGARKYPRTLTPNTDFSKCAQPVNIQLTPGQLQADGTYINDYAYIVWEVPRGWTIDRYYGKVSYTKNSTVIQGQSLTNLLAYPYSDDPYAGIPLGVIKASITYADGQKEVLTFNIPSTAAQAPRAAIDNNNLTICKNMGATLNASPNNPSLYNYTWTGNEISSLNVIGGLNGPSLVLSAQQWNTNYQTVVVTIVNKTSQCKSYTYSEIRQVGWGDAIPFGENRSFTKNYDDGFYQNIVTDKKGNAYYMSGDGGANNPPGIYTLQWDAPNRIWRNYSLPKGGPIFSSVPSTLGITDDGAGVGTLYYLGTDSKIHAHVLGTTTQTVLQTSTTVAGSIYANRNNGGYDEVIYRDFQNNLWRYKTNTGQSYQIATNIDVNLSNGYPAISPIVVNGKVIYTKNNGQVHVNATPLQNPDGTPLLAGVGYYGSNFAPYNTGGGNYKVYFVLGNTTGALKDQMAQLDLATLNVSIMPHTGTGINFMSVNQSSGIIYYNNDRKEVRQMYDQNTSHVADGVCIVPLWNAGITYQTGDEVLYNGIIYQAAYTTQNQIPDQRVAGAYVQPWTSYGPCLYAVAIPPIWRDVLVSSANSGSNGFMQYAYPNVWYGDENGNMSFSFFSTSYCAPAIYREAAGSTDTNEELLANRMSVAPNPTSGWTTLSLFVAEPSKADITLTNVSGVQVYEQSQQVDKGAHAIQIDTEKLLSGLYILRVSYSNGTSQSLRLMVAK